jgi:transcriptional regulator with XRE-family HTH domain
VPFGNRNKQNGRPQHPLSSIREKENLGQDELSIIIGTSVYMISRIETGYSQLPLKNLDTLSDVYDLDIEEYNKKVKDFQYKMRDYLLALY